MPLSHIAATALLYSLLAQQWWIDDFGFSETGLDGSGVTIAVIDTGVDTSHPDLVGTVIGGADFSSVGTPDGTEPVGASSFHGTMVASLIAGQGDGVDSVAGVAPGARLLSISIGLGVRGADTDTQLAQAMLWAVDQGADIINLSLSRNSEKWPKQWDEAFSYAFDNDVLVVAASGNLEQGRFATAPAVIPGVISVTAVDQAGNTGGASGSNGIGVSIAAPGENLLGAFPGGERVSWSGSSAAAPIVSGLLALMQQKDPAASANDLVERLIRTATDAGAEGFDAEYGWGIIDPAAAIDSQAVATENPLGSLRNWIALYRADVPEDSAELLVPISPELPAEQPVAASAESDEPVNPLLYLLVIPLILLPLIFGKRLRRLNLFGKEK